MQIIHSADSMHASGSVSLEINSCITPPSPQSNISVVFLAGLSHAPVRSVVVFHLDCCEGDQALTSQHGLIGVVRDGEDVWRGLLALLASVGQHHLCIVHWQPLVGVDSDTEET